MSNGCKVKGYHWCRTDDPEFQEKLDLYFEKPKSGVNIWSEEEDNILRTYYQSEGKECSKRLIGRSGLSVQLRAHKLGLRDLTDNSTHVKRYSDEEINFLCNNYEKLTVEEISQHLGRTKGSIHRMCSTLGIHKK